MECEIKMNLSIKDKINCISYTVYGLGAFFTILGISVGIIPLILSILNRSDFTGLYLSVLSVFYAFFSQTMILGILFQNFKNKSKIEVKINVKSRSFKRIIFYLSLSSLIFLLLSGILVSAEETLPSTGQLLFF